MPCEDITRDSQGSQVRLGALVAMEGFLWSVPILKPHHSPRLFPSVSRSMNFTPPPPPPPQKCLGCLAGYQGAPGAQGAPYTQPGPWRVEPETRHASDRRQQLVGDCRNHAVICKHLDCPAKPQPSRIRNDGLVCFSTWPASGATAHARGGICFSLERTSLPAGVARATMVD